MPPVPSIAGALDGRRRAIVEAVSPQIDGGRHPIKRTLGEEIVPGSRYLWRGAANFVQPDPLPAPAAVPRIRSECDVGSFL